MGRPLYEQVVYPTVIRQAGVDVFLGCNSVLPLRLRVPSVVVMQSLQYFDFPELYSWPTLAYLRTLVPWGLRKATRIIVPSETSKQTVIENVPIPAAKIRVIYHGVSSDILGTRGGANHERGRLLLEKLVGGRPYVLSVSSFYWQKNLPRLVESFAQLKHELSIPHLLVLVGAESAKITRRSLLRLATQLGIAEHVVFAGVVPHHLIRPFYLNASLTVMPSLYETFGCPIPEAMSCGCPVLTSKIGTMAEIAQDCAVLVDPYSVDSISHGMARVLQDADLRSGLIACGRVRAQAFTLEAQASAYLQALEEAANA